MQKKLFLFFFLVILSIHATAYTIEGNSVFMEDEQASLRVTPHTASSPVNNFKQEFTLCNKTETGRIIYSAYVFNQQLESGKIEHFLNPEYDWVEYEKNCSFDFNYVLNEDSDQNPHRAWCFDADQNGSGIDVILWEQEFKTGSLETATIQWDVNELVFGNEWIDITDSYQNNYRELNEKHFYPNIQGTVFQANTCKTWRIEYSPKETDLTDKWDLWLWTDIWGWDCILTDSCQKTLKLDPWWDSDWESKYPINSFVISPDLNSYNWITLEAVDFSALNIACGNADDLTIVNETTQTEVTDLNFQIWNGTSTDTTVNVSFKLTEALASNTYNGEYYIYSNNSGCSAPTNRTIWNGAYDDFEDNDLTSDVSWYPSYGAGAYGTSVNAVKNGVYGVRLNPARYITTDIESTDILSFVTWWRVNDATLQANVAFHGSSGNFTDLKMVNDKWTFYTTGWGSSTSTITPVDNTWYIVRIDLNAIGETTDYYIYDASGVLLEAKLGQGFAESSSDITKIQLKAWTSILDMDDITILPPATPTYSLGSEESLYSCSCPASGHWEIINGDICTLTDECNLTGGDLHIVDGSLNITSTGTLTIQSGQKIIITRNNNLFIEKLAKIVLRK